MAKPEDIVLEGEFTVRNRSSVWKKLCEAVGIDPSKKPELLGEGTRGTVWDIGNGRVMKITNDDTEAKTMAIVRDHPEPNGFIVKVEKVFKLGEDAVAPYAIIQEKLEAPTPDMIAIANSWRDYLDNRDYDADIDVRQVRNFIQLNESWMDEEFQNWFKALAIYFKQRRIQFSDLHAGKEGDGKNGNIMRRGSTPVLIDLGYSISPGTEPNVDDVLAKLISVVGSERF